MHDLNGAKNGLIEHHIKYKEIHGYDKTVWLTWSEHKRLHIRLRKEGKCQVSPDELKVISSKAYMRTSKYKHLACRLSRDRTHETRKHFTKSLAPNISLFTDILYYINTGNVSVTSYFHSSHGKRLITIKELS